MQNINDIRRTNLAVLIREAGGIGKFAERVGMSESQLGQLAKGYKHSDTGKMRGMKVETAARLALAGGRPADWLDKPHDEPEAHPMLAGVAQPMSQYTVTVAPQPIAWEHLNMGTANLPDSFTLSLPDDAMAPRLREGDLVELRRSRTAKPGDLVLVKTGAGDHYVREYRRAGPGDWIAFALNDAYDSLASTRDNLEIVAAADHVRTTYRRD